MTDLDGTERELASRRIGDTEATAVRIRRRYDAPIEDVWEACTVPDRLDRWFLSVTGDLRPGGSFQLHGNAGGEIMECEPPHRLRISWAQLVDVIAGVGVGWEVPLSYTLPLYLAGELADRPASEWYTPTAEHEHAAERLGQVWAALVGE